jgi:hypothetical protein
MIARRTYVAWVAGCCLPTRRAIATCEQPRANILRCSPRSRLNCSLMRHHVQRALPCREWSESLRVKVATPLGEDELQRLWRERRQETSSNQGIGR